MASLWVGGTAGAVAGTLHFLSLRRVARWLVEGRTGAALLLQFARLALLGLALLPVARLGAAALLAALAGVLAARTLVLRRSGPV